MTWEELRRIERDARNRTVVRGVVGPHQPMGRAAAVIERDRHGAVGAELLVELGLVILTDLGLIRSLIQSKADQLDKHRLAAALRAEDRRQALVQVQRQAIEKSST